MATLRGRADNDAEERKILRFLQAKYGSLAHTAEASARVDRLESLGNRGALDDLRIEMAAESDEVDAQETETHTTTKRASIGSDADLPEETGGQRQGQG